MQIHLHRVRHIKSIVSQQLAKNVTWISPGHAELVRVGTLERISCLQDVYDYITSLNQIIILGNKSEQTGFPGVFSI